MAIALVVVPTLILSVFAAAVMAWISGARRRRNRRLYRARVKSLVISYLAGFSSALLLITVTYIATIF